MNKEDKIKYIRSFHNLIEESLTYRDALSHATYIKGMIGAWGVDLSFTVAECAMLRVEIEMVLTPKRDLPMKGDVV